MTMGIGLQLFWGCLLTNFMILGIVGPGDARSGEHIYFCFHVVESPKGAGGGRFSYAYFWREWAVRREIPNPARCDVMAIEDFRSECAVCYVLCMLESNLLLFHGPHNCLAPSTQRDQRRSKKACALCVSIVC